MKYKTMHMNAKGMVLMNMNKPKAKIEILMMLMKRNKMYISAFKIHFIPTTYIN